MDSNLPYFSLPFVDTSDLDFGKIRDQECEYDDLNPTLPPHGSLLGADDVLAQFLSDDPLEEPDLNGPTTLHCEICRKQFDSAKKYYGHLRVHSKENLWICEKCPEEKFSSKQQLMKHSLTHKPLSKVWRCPQCEMSFEALWRLQQHLFAKHLDYRPHKCDVCTKTFHKLSDLDKHMDIHEAIKKYLCSTCKRRFADKSNLKRHLLTHSSEKPYSCIGCGHWFKQIASMKRHSQHCPLVQKSLSGIKKSYRNNYCRVCGLTFQYKSSLLEHCVRTHSTNPPEPPPEPPKEDKSHQLHVDTSRTVDKIVDDILAAEDDYMNMSTQNDLINNYPTEENQDNLMQMELLKEINQIHNMQILDDELYNDIDLDTLQNMCNNIDYDRNELFDLNDGRSMDHIMNGKSLDQDIMNAIVCDIDQNKEELPKEFINPEMNSKVNEFLVNPPVSVNECSTIFESDVDLEASTNLAANLNQLIGENSVQYISTEHDDTFIINLNSEIDAEQLTDMLNVGVEKPIPKPIRTEPDFQIQPETTPVLSMELNPLKTAEETIREEKMEVDYSKAKMKTKYVCLVCKRIFKTKHNYISHRAVHDPDLQQFQCTVCSERFSYKSTLNKHFTKKHTPSVKPAHPCYVCHKIYNSSWLLKQHTERVHELIQPYKCDFNDCGKKFYRRNDLETHTRFHTGERPFVCKICGKGFKAVSHLARHTRRVNGCKLVTNEANPKKKEPKVKRNVKNKTKKTNDTSLIVTTEGTNSEVPKNDNLIVKPINSKTVKNKTKKKNDTSLLVTTEGTNSEVPKNDNLIVKPINSKTVRNKTKKKNDTSLLVTTEGTNSEVPKNDNLIVKPINSKTVKNKTKKTNDTSLLVTTEGTKYEIPKNDNMIVKPINSKTVKNKTKRPKTTKTATLQNSKMEGINSEIPKNANLFVLPTNSKVEGNKTTMPITVKTAVQQNSKMEGINSELPKNSRYFVIPMNSKIENKSKWPITVKTMVQQNSKMEENQTQRPEICFLTSQNLNVEEYKTKSQASLDGGLILGPQILKNETSQANGPKIVEFQANTCQNDSLILMPPILKVGKQQTMASKVEENKATRPETGEFTSETPKCDRTLILTPHHLKLTMPNSNLNTVQYYLALN